MAFRRRKTSRTVIRTHSLYFTFKSKNTRDIEHANSFPFCFTKNTLIVRTIIPIFYELYRYSVKHYFCKD